MSTDAGVKQRLDEKSRRTALVMMKDAIVDITLRYPCLSNKVPTAGTACTQNTS